MARVASGTDHRIVSLEVKAVLTTEDQSRCAHYDDMMVMASLGTDEYDNNLHASVADGVDRTIHHLLHHFHCCPAPARKPTMPQSTQQKQQQQQ